MKKIIINKTIIIFLNVNDFDKYNNRNLINLKNEYLLTYDNCIIYNYFDLKNNKNLIKSRIEKLKFINQIKINARKCEIKQITSNEKNIFLNKYHLQGTDKSQIFYGAFYYDELISVMSFDTNNGMSGGIDDNTYMLSRFTIKSNYLVTGIFNKILKKFIRDFKPQKILSFGDLNYVNKKRNLYDMNGFKLTKTISPDYKYYHKKNEKLYHKFTFGTKYKKNNKITIQEKKETYNNLIKLWNCGKLKYELFIDNENEVVFGFIYKILNKINNKIYIGQTTRTLKSRIYEYKSHYNKSHTNSHLFNSFNKYGWDNFKFTIIDTAQTINDLNSKEIKYIEEYKSNNKKFGYNIELGGNNAIPTTETLEKMSRSHKGIKQTTNWVNKRIANAGSEDAKKYGRAKTDAEKKYLSENSTKYWAGKTRDEETRKKISETKKRNGPSDKLKTAIYKTVYKRNIKTNEIIVTYESTGEAGKIEGVNQSTISRWCNKNKIKDDFQWSYH